MSHNLTGTKTIQQCSVEQIAAAVLYEGYILYPYRASAAKNRHRFNFGTLTPRSFSEFQSGSDACTMRTECLVTGGTPKLDIKVRFLQPTSRQVGKLLQPLAEFDAEPLPTYETVASLDVNGEILQTWQEVVEREISIIGLNVSELLDTPNLTEFSFSANQQIEPLRENADGVFVGLILREQEFVTGCIEVSCERISAELTKVAVTISNDTPLENCQVISREQVTLHSLASTHTILTIAGGEFVSLLEPPEEFVDSAAICNNEGCWPVLSGDPGTRTTMLSSPIILYDYPQIATESDGDFFDGCEIDEMLALRVMTLTEDEKQQMRCVDERARKILDRTDTRPEDYLMKLHGTMRKQD